MGCIPSKEETTDGPYAVVGTSGSTGSPSPQRPPRKAPLKITAARETAWRKTGIVGLRDANLKDIPTKVFTTIHESVRTIDATNNRISEVRPLLECPLPTAAPSG
jgi:hypothetical protein